MPNCERLGEIMSYAEMQSFGGSEMPFGTVRWSGKAPTINAAIVVTRLGVEDDKSMPHCDWITETHFYLVSTGLPKTGIDIILRQVESPNAPQLRLFYRRGTGKGFQHLGLIQFEAEEPHSGFRAFGFKRLFPTSIQHAG